MNYLCSQTSPFPLKQNMKMRFIKLGSFFFFAESLTSPIRGDIHMHPLLSPPPLSYDNGYHVMQRRESSGRRQASTLQRPQHKEFSSMTFQNRNCNKKHQARSACPNGHNSKGVGHFTTLPRGSSNLDPVPPIRGDVTYAQLNLTSTNVRSPSSPSLQNGPTSPSPTTVYATIDHRMHSRLLQHPLPPMGSIEESALANDGVDAAAIAPVPPEFADDPVKEPKKFVTFDTSSSIADPTGVSFLTTDSAAAAAAASGDDSVVNLTRFWKSILSNESFTFRSRSDLVRRRNVPKPCCTVCISNSSS